MLDQYHKLSGKRLWDAKHEVFNLFIIIFISVCVCVCVNDLKIQHGFLLKVCKMDERMDFSEDLCVGCSFLSLDLLSFDPFPFLSFPSIFSTDTMI